MKGCCTWSKGADKDLNWRGRLSSLFLGYSPLTGTCRLLTCCRDAKVYLTQDGGICVSSRQPTNHPGHQNSLLPVHHMQSSTRMQAPHPQ